ncbi:TPA: hypothetical protein SJ503_004295 [Yersinia enterocolitica]|nr:hypothetical protein [Yersinia enterocolitica]HEI6781479.1 hypothetical protein [Yersinia enterocolitica]HEI6840750.1 hypothetical protein [Yersinia enterocolitica]HEI6916865.1 hypothetical protein [Yersinia enterocolitica]HEI6925173.1 hypothetical protein [Yersinia enterocolitica]
MKIKMRNFRRISLHIIMVLLFSNNAFSANLSQLVLEKTSEWKYSVTVNYPLETGWLFVNGSYGAKYWVQRGSLYFQIYDKNGNSSLLDSKATWDLVAPCAINSSIEGGYVTVRSNGPNYYCMTPNSFGSDPQHWKMWVNATIEGSIRSNTKPDFSLTNVYYGDLAGQGLNASITSQNVVPSKSDSLVFSYYPQLSFDEVGMDTLGFVTANGAYTSTCMNYTVDNSHPEYIDVKKYRGNDNRLCINEQLNVSVIKMPPTYGETKVNLRINLSLP